MKNQTKALSYFIARSNEHAIYEFYLYLKTIYKSKIAVGITIIFLEIMTLISSHISNNYILTIYTRFLFTINSVRKMTTLHLL